MKDIVKLLLQAVDRLENEHSLSTLSGHRFLSQYTAAKEVHEINLAENNLKREVKEAYKLKRVINKIKKQVAKLESMD
jgi:hypothetical protein